MLHYRWQPHVYLSWCLSNHTWVFPTSIRVIHGTMGSHMRNATALICRCSAQLLPVWWNASGSLGNAASIYLLTKPILIANHCHGFVTMIVKYSSFTKGSLPCMYLQGTLLYNQNYWWALYLAIYSENAMTKFYIGGFEYSMERNPWL